MPKYNRCKIQLDKRVTVDSLRQKQIEYLQRIMREKRLSSINKLAKAIKVSGTTFTRFINNDEKGQRYLSSCTLDKLHNYSHIIPPMLSSAPNEIHFDLWEAVTIGSINFLKNNGYLENMHPTAIAKFISVAYKIFNDSKQQNSDFSLDDAHYGLIYGKVVNG